MCASATAALNKHGQPGRAGGYALHSSKMVAGTRDTDQLRMFAWNDEDFLGNV